MARATLCPWARHARRLVDVSDLFDALRPGTRVVVRYRLDDGGAHTLSDALGVFDGVLSAPPSGGAPPERAVRILTRRGPVIIPTARVTRAKPVPAPPPRRA